jgi:hypothetical protein
MKPKKEKLMSGNVVQFFDKIVDKGERVLRIYNNHPRTMHNIKVMK